jgi:hypothetical protein
VKTLPLQLAWRQPMAVDQGLHAPFPLQVPSFEQSPAPALLGKQRCLGSDWPLTTGEQVPTLPLSLQVMHRPPVAESLQAEWQHTPSVQKPLPHCDPAVQAAPLGLRPHELFTQVLGTTQSLSWLQEERHAGDLHTKVPQDWSDGVAHLPCPSQAEAGVWEEVPEQVEPLHASPLAK